MADIKLLTCGNDGVNFIASRHRSAKAGTALTKPNWKESGMARRIMATCERCGQSYLTGVQYPKRFCTRDCQWGTPEERFEKYTDRTPGHGPNGDCWLWTKTFTTHGYGQFSINNKTVKAHKYSYEIHNGPIPKGMCVCHSCDIPSCVNPAHLWLGTQSQNMKDCYAKGRSRGPTGEGHPRAKLKDADVIKILSDDRLHKTIATEYGVDPSIIGYIKSGKIWKHLTLPWLEAKSS